MVKIAACQMGGSEDSGENLRTMVRLFKRAVEGMPGLDVIVFPETAYYLPADAAGAVKEAVDPALPHPFLDTMRELAKEHRVYLIPGSFVAKAENGRVKNTAVLIDRQGEIVARYDKVHLMAAAGCDESSWCAPGDHLTVADTDFGRIGLMVCYDLRFPEQARSMCLQGAEILFVPAAWPSGRPLPPRVDDWDLLVRSTALTNAAYVVACNQLGRVRDDNFFGRTCVTDPRGVPVAAAGGREDVVYGFIDLDYRRAVQEDLGVWRNRRPELYRL